VHNLLNLLHDYALTRIGLQSRRKNDTVPAPELFCSWKWLQLRSFWFSWL